MEFFKKTIAFLMVILMSLGALAGCSSVKETDAYMTKGEFMLLFASETGINPSLNPTIRLNIDSNNKYYDAAVALVEIGYLTHSEATSNLDDAVTKEFVACLCVDYLYFRSTFNVAIKDEKKLSDPQACKDAVGHGIVELENGYFDANAKMTYRQCQAAIDRAKHIDATSSFKKDDAKLDYTLKEGVIDVNALDEDFTLEYIDPESAEGKAVIDDYYATPNTIGTSYNDRGSYQNSSETEIIQTNVIENKQVKPINLALEGDLVIIKCHKLERRFLVDDIIVYVPQRMSDALSNSSPHLAYSNYSIGGVVKHVSYVKPPNVSTMDDNVYYTVEIVSAEQLAKFLEIEGYNSKENGAQLAFEKDKEAKDYGIEANFSNQVLSVSFKSALEFSRDKELWSEPKYKIDVTYNFSVKDISFDISGFGDIFDGNINNAICSLKYTIDNTLTLESKNRITPANNGNGKFPSNLMRSRLTAIDSDGSKTIKIGKFHMEIYAGIGVDIEIGLVITMDGKVTVQVINNCANGFKIKNNKIMPLDDPKQPTQTKPDFYMNAEIGVDVWVAITLFRCRIADAGVTAGIGISCYASVIEQTEESGTSSYIGYVTKEELDEYKKEIEFQYTLSGRLYFFARFRVLTDKSIMGRVLKKGDISLELPSIDITLCEWQYANGQTETVDKPEAIGENKPVSNDREFTLNTYKVILNETDCTRLDIISIPVNGDAIDDMGGINVYSKDSSVATIHIYNGVIVIEAVDVGSTELIIETRNKRFSQVCSITVVADKYM